MSVNILKYTVSKPYDKSNFWVEYGTYVICGKRLASNPWERLPILKLGHLKAIIYLLLRWKTHELKGMTCAEIIKKNNIPNMSNILICQPKIK